MAISFDSHINDILERVKTTLHNKFKGNIKAIILYGSWVKGTAKKDSDIDLLVIFTAVKREGRIISGDIDLAINPELPQKKYKEFFKRSKELENYKVEMAEKICREFPDYGSSDLCFVASKHAIQMALAMRGVGYTSKIGVLLLLTKEHLGEGFFRAFKKLLDLYIRSEYNIERLSREEVQESISIAKKILKVCYGDNK